MALAGGYSSDETPGLGTSICHRSGSRNRKKKKKKKKKNDVLNIRLKNLNLIVGNKDQIFEQMTGWKLSVCQKSVIPAMACRVDIGKRVLAFK